MRQNFESALPKIDSESVFEVLDSETGALKQEGWLKYPNKLLYNPRMASKSLINRNKMWNYFYIISENHLITMAHTDVGIARAAYINIRDISDWKKPTFEVQFEDTFSKHVFIDSEKNGGGVFSSVHSDLLNMTYFGRANEDQLLIDISAIDRADHAKGNFKGNTKNIEGIQMMHSPKTDLFKHFFGYKLPLIEFTGELSLNGNTIVKCPEDKPCLGLQDSGRSVLSYVYNWIWVSTCFRKDNHKIAINLGYTIDDTSSSYDSVFVDEKLYKLDPMMIDTQNPDHLKWKSSNITNTKNHLSLEFVPQSDHTMYKNYGLIYLNFKSNYGHYKGRITTSDGHNITFEKVFGILEDVHIRG